MRQWVIGKTHYDYCHKRGMPKSFADTRHRYMNKCIKEKKLVTFEEPIVDKTGKLRVYMRMFSPVLDVAGKVTHVIGHGQEITALKKNGMIDCSVRRGHEQDSPAQQPALAGRRTTPSGRARPTRHTA